MLRDTDDRSTASRKWMVAGWSEVIARSPFEAGRAIPEMREAPELPEPPSQIWVLHPASDSLFSDDRLYFETPQAVEETVSSPSNLCTPGALERQ